MEQRKTAKLYRKSELSKIPDGVTLDNSYWYYFLILEKDFEESLRFIELSENNLNAYSLEYVKQLICISTEFETICKLLCDQINGSKPGNIGDYKQTILTRFPKIWSTKVFVDKQRQFSFQPLGAWENKGGKLDWWGAYTNIKHTRHNNFENATLKNTLEALGALLILENYLYKLAYKTPKSSRFGTSLLRVEGMAEPVYYPKESLPDFN